MVRYYPFIWYDRNRARLLMASATALAGKVDLGMYDAHMSSEGIVPAERLLFGTQVTSHLLLARIVNGVLVSCEVVRSREDGVARLARRGIDALAFVGSRLRVPQ